LIVIQGGIPSLHSRALAPVTQLTTSRRMPASPVIDYDVIVVGGGLAGLRAARELNVKSRRLRVLVLEAKERVGGRTSTVSLRTGGSTSGGDVDTWDLGACCVHVRRALRAGGQWVGNTQHDMLELLREMNVDTYEQYAEGEKLAQIGASINQTINQSARRYDDPTVLGHAANQHGPHALQPARGGRLCAHLLQVGGARRRGASHVFHEERRTAQVSVTDPHSSASAGEYDELTLAAYARQKCWTRTMIDSLDLTARAVLGCAADQSVSSS